MFTSKIEVNLLTICGICILHYFVDFFYFTFAIELNISESKKDKNMRSWAIRWTKIPLYFPYKIFQYA